MSDANIFLTGPGRSFVMSGHPKRAKTAGGFRFRTTQVQAMKTMIEAIKDVVTEVNITFDASGVRVAAMDSAHVCLVYASLQAPSIEEYDCAGAHVLGVNMLSLYKIVKTVAVNETLSMSYDPGTPELEIVIRNEEKRTDKAYALALMDIDEDAMTIPDKQFEFVINMNAVDFQHICRDLSVISDAATLECTAAELVFRSQGDFAKAAFTVREGGGPESEGGPAARMSMTCGAGASDGGPLRATFSLKYLLSFTKATGLCTAIDIYFGRNFPLVVEYAVANLGRLKFCLAPRQEDPEPAGGVEYDEED